MVERFTTPKLDDLGLKRIGGQTGLGASILPNGALFSIDYRTDASRILVSQTLASPLAGGMSRLFLRLGGGAPVTLALTPPEGTVRFGANEDRCIWEQRRNGLSIRLTLWFPPNSLIWFWRIDLDNQSVDSVLCDLVLIQDIGLGDAGFLMNNEAYASQYIDHKISFHSRTGNVILSRQNLSQGGTHPWAMHGCLEGEAGFATDFRQVLGPVHRDEGHFALPFGTNLPAEALQYETGCAALQSKPISVPPGQSKALRFFGCFQSNHPDASSDADLARIDDVERAAASWREQPIELDHPHRSLIQDAALATSEDIRHEALNNLYPERRREEFSGDDLLSFFVDDSGYRRHVVLREKERRMARRHGGLLRSGNSLLPTQSGLSITCWMHGVFGAQLTFGNTALHQVFSISRDPYNIQRTSGLRILFRSDNDWRMLGVPSAFEMGLSDCRWVYKFGSSIVSVSLHVSAEADAAQWRIGVVGAPLQFIVCANVVIGEREFAQAGRIEIDRAAHSFTFRPDPESLWGKRYPDAMSIMTTSHPACVEAMGGDELLYATDQKRLGASVVYRTQPTQEFTVSVVGSMTDPALAASLAQQYASGVSESDLSISINRFWRSIHRDLQFKSQPSVNRDVEALETIYPWFIHDAMIHLTIPHGLEQYIGAAWGTRDVCQGPIELLLSLEHDETVASILTIVFEQQYEDRGDWPQWFMLEPYSFIQDKQAHGDVIIWPLKALCDYIEATGDFAFLDKELAWRNETSFEKTRERASVEAHVAKLLETICSRFIPNTHLIKYGHGDWNDSLQPVDSAKREWLVSSWTVALLYEQLRRYAEILRRAKRPASAQNLEKLSDAMRCDFNNFLMRDDVVAGYGLFNPNGSPPQLLLHPSDKATGIFYSLIPMTQAILGGLFTESQALVHINLIKGHLLAADGARLMDKPMAYRGGVETLFRRAESSANVGREIGLMYVHSHLRYAEALAFLDQTEDFLSALTVVNPICVTERLPNAALRQRNAYFSSSDAAFPNRYAARQEWARVKAQTISVEGGWRIYSSGPGIYVSLLITRLAGRRRRFGQDPQEAQPASESRVISLTWPDPTAN